MLGFSFPGFFKKAHFEIVFVFSIFPNKQINFFRFDLSCKCTGFLSFFRPLVDKCGLQ